MAQQEAGKWKPYNVKAIVNNVALVFKNRNINKLNNPAYNFIIQHMGFIAHYSLQGFQDSYADLEDFARKLQTSEYSDDHGYNLREADRRERDGDFQKWYGPVYNKSVAEAIRGIVEVARKYYPGTRGTMPMFDPEGDFRASALPVTRAPAKKKKRTRTATRPDTSVRGVRS